MPDRELLFKHETYDIIGAAMEVYNELGAGFLEPVYHEALQLELESRGIKALHQVELPILYKGKPLTKRYICDVLCYSQILLELKAISTLTSNEEAQVLNYLKASNLRLGLLINFGNAQGLQWKRFVC
jgi:GxxExxY protein